MKVLGFSIPLLVVIFAVFVVGAKYGAPYVAKIPIIGK